MGTNSKKPLAEVWGDTLALNELFYASVLGIVLTMTGYILGTRYFSGRPDLDPGLAKGYALMFGIIGCVLAGVISAKLFKPKRVIEEKYEQEDIKAVLAAAGMTLEEEAQALANIDADILKEMEDLELYALLDLRETGKATEQSIKGGGLNVTN